MPPRKAIPTKLKALLQKEIRSTCPFCDSQDVDHFQFHHIDGNRSRSVFENLLMLCANCHSKITKGDITTSEVLRVKALLGAQKNLANRQQNASSIFTAREERDFEHIRSKLDKLVPVAVSPQFKEKSSKRFIKYWDISISALELLLMAYTDNSKSLGFYDSWERDRTLVIAEKSGTEKHFFVAATQDYYDPVPELLQCDLVTLRKDWQGHREFTKKMHKFVHWIEYHRITPLPFEAEQRTIRRQNDVAGSGP